MADDALADFTRETFTHESASHPVYRSGSGPAVIVLAEIPGITPRVAAFARRVRELGLTVVVPDLFGVAGRDPRPAARGWAGAVGYTASTIARVCVSREFTLFATGRTSPIVTWLRALAAHEHERCGGPGVGAVGMCLTGGFALAMAVDDRLVAPVLSEPSLPVPVTPSRRHTVDIGATDLAVVQQRCAAGLQVVGMRFRGDRLVPDARFRFLRETLGDAFVAVELDDDAADPTAHTPPHSVLTEHFIDAPGEPTRAALDTVLELFRRRLLTEADTGQPG